MISIGSINSSKVQVFTNGGAAQAAAGAVPGSMGAGRIGRISMHVTDGCSE